MTEPGAAAKYGSAMLLPVLAALPVSSIEIAAIAVAIVFAWMAKAAQLFHTGQTGRDICRDMVVNVLMGFTVGLFTLALMIRTEMDLVDGVIAAWVMAFSGMPVLSLARTYLMKGWGWLQRSIIDDAIAEGKRREAAHLEQLRNQQADQERNAKQMRGRGDDN